MAKVDLSGILDGSSDDDPQRDAATPPLTVVPDPHADPPTHDAPPADSSALAALIPEPHPPVADGPLIEQEAAELAACESAILAEQVAFVWVIGKALATISQGKLYREKYARFDDYLSDVWELSPARGYQLIAAYPVAERIATTTPIDMRRVNEGKLRALMPVVKSHGVDDAVMVFATVTEVATEVDGAKVTAKLLSKVAVELPAGHLDRDDVAARAKMILTAADPPAEEPHPWEAAREAAVRALRKMADTRSDPAAMRAAITELEALLNKLRGAAESHGGDDD